MQGWGCPHGFTGELLCIPWVCGFGIPLHNTPRNRGFCEREGRAVLVSPQRMRRIDHSLSPFAYFATVSPFADIAQSLSPGRTVIVQSLSGRKVLNTSHIRLYRHKSAEYLTYWVIHR